MAPHQPKPLSSAAVWSIAGGVTQQLSTFIIFIVLARLLSPREFGIMALAAGAMDVLLVLFRAGIPELILQEADTTELRLSTSFWLSLIFGAIAATALLSGAPFIAHFYDIPELKGLCQLLALVCLIQSSSLIHETLIKRSLNYKALTIRLGAAATVGGLAAVLLAFHGAGVYALLAQRIFLAASLSVLAWHNCPWRPGWSFSRQDASRIILHGPKLSLGFTLGYLAPKIMEAVLAAQLGAAILGLYRIASRTIDLIAAVAVTPMTQLALPLLAHYKDHPDGHAKLALLQTGIVYLAAPIVLGAIIVSEPLIEFVYGPKWHGAGLLLAILAPTLLVASISSSVESILSAYNRAASVITLNSFQLISTTLLTLGAAPLGPSAIAATQTLRATATAMLAIRLANPVLPLSQVISRVPFKPLVAALCAELATLLLIKHAVPTAPILVTIFSAAFAYAIVLVVMPPLDYQRIWHRRRRNTNSEKPHA